jgi:acyl carrier protein
MARRKPTAEDQKEIIDLILSEELELEAYDSLLPSAKLASFDPDPDAIAFIIVRLEDDLLITIPDGAEEKLVTVKDVYDCVARIAR